jgi:hypothetical protein
MSDLVSVSGRIGAYHDLYVGAAAGASMHAFWDAHARFLRRKRQTLLDVAMEASAAQAQVWQDFDDLDPSLQQAVRETNPGLGERRWFSMDEDERLGAISAAKGKYFEYLVVERLNAGEQVGEVMLATGQQAVVAESMTQPGWDVRIVSDDGAVVQYLQMKATDSGAYIREALERYPDFQIVATSEVGAQLDGNAMLLDANIGNEELKRQVGDAVDLADDAVTERFIDYFCPLWPLMAIAAMEGYKVSIGQASIDAFVEQMAVRGKRLLAIKLAGATAFALGGWLLAIPAGLAGGLWYDRFRNVHGLDERYARGTDRLLSLATYRHRQLLLEGRA